MAIELTPAKLAELKKKAAGCDPKYWIMDQHGDVVAVDFDSEGTQPKIASVEFLEDAEHIAAADPATVLAMVEEIDLLKKRLSWFPAHIKEKIDLAILAHTGGMADPCKEHCGCDDSVGYYCEYCAVYDALISCKQATESEAGQ